MALKEKPKKEIPQVPELKTAIIALRGTAVKIVPRGSAKIQVIQQG